MNSPKKFAFAALAAAALTFGAAAPAFAADIQVGPDAVAGFENGTAGDAGFNYTQWHMGNISDPAAPVSDSLSFGECNVTVLEAPDYANSPTAQVLLGFDTRPSTRGTSTTADIQALFDGISIDVASGSVTLQVPVFMYWDGEGNDPNFTTFRNSVAFGPGVHSFAGSELINSNNFYAPGSVADVIAMMQSDIDAFGDVIEVLGVGFTGTPGTVVNSITFGGNTYYFGTGSCAPAVIPAPSVPTKVETAVR